MPSRIAECQSKSDSTERRIGEGKQDLLRRIKCMYIRPINMHTKNKFCDWHQ